MYFLPMTLIATIFCNKTLEQLLLTVGALLISSITITITSSFIGGDSLYFNMKFVHTGTIKEPIETITLTDKKDNIIFCNITVKKYPNILFYLEVPVVDSKTEENLFSGNYMIATGKIYKNYFKTVFIYEKYYVCNIQE